MPNGIPAPTPLLELAAFFMRTETELVLKSRRVIPSRLLDAGFKFEYSQLGHTPPKTWWRGGADPEHREPGLECNPYPLFPSLHLCHLGVISVTGRSQWAARISNRRCSSFL